MKSKTDIANLLKRIPYFIMAGPIPPLRVVNDVTKRGLVDAGMSGAVRWQPFELDERDYFEVIEELKRITPSLVACETPSEVVTYQQWMEWRLICRLGERGIELPELFALQRTIVANLRLAEKSGDDTKIGQLQLQLIKLGTRINEILNSTRNP